MAQQDTSPAEQNQSRIGLHCFYKHPTLVVTALFLLMLSGPPKLRPRDPTASLNGEIDGVIMLHLVVWGLAGLWVLLEVGKRLFRKRPVLSLNLPQILGLGLILCLSISVWKSAAPALTAFKVYQMAISLLFTQFVVELFGPAQSLKIIFWGNTLLCVLLAICAWLVPNLVWVPSDFNPDPSRLKGDLIAPAGAVCVFAIILLLTGVRRIYRILPLLLLALFVGLLAFSLMRTAYLVMIIYFGLVLLKRPSAKPPKQIAYALCAIIFLCYACNWLPNLGEYRKPEDMSNLGDRIGLWQHLAHVTIDKSPWFGLGYYSASRIHGPEYNPLLGTAHSMFFEVLSGGGLLSFALMVALTVTLLVYAVRLLALRKDRFSFAVSLLFIACLLFGFMGDEIDSGPVAIAFWYSVAVLPWLATRALERRLVVRGAMINATA
jgi:O-antigen ligase